MTTTHTTPTEQPDWNKANNLGLQERQLMMQITGPQPPLEYPTETLKMSNGCEIERYIIPDADKQKVLNDLYPFADSPSLDDELVDIHTGKRFAVRDYIVTREGNGNFLVTPYYAEAGGTVLDWIKPELEKQDALPMTVKICKLRSAILQ